MEDSSTVDFMNGPRHRPLTALRAVQGVLCILIQILTALMLLVYIGFWTNIILRLFSIRYSRVATSILFGSWLALWPFLFEKINKTKVIFSGDSVPPKERVLLISNHRTEVDWMYIWDLALRKGSIGHVKYVLKNSLMKIPLFGWAFHAMEFIPVERKWETDQRVMRKILSTYKDPRESLWLVVFPEGTDYTEQKCLRCQEYASEHGLPILKNVLLPKSKGFYACVEELRDNLDAVYDITIAYKHRYPTFLDNAFGVDPSEVHIHVRRLSISGVPVSEDEVASWLMGTFSLKDQLLSDFHSEGCFPGEVIEGDLSLEKCLTNFIIVMILTGLCTYLTFFSSIWFKVYVFSVCAYFTSATYLKFQPSPLIS
ncbi:hypothetical protein Leryth_020011 [Lithospermum erythrorhizon]|nr:hypothetical protein Leryth_020011 [Lithospermum erythrorhizon]